MANALDFFDLFCETPRDDVGTSNLSVAPTSLTSVAYMTCMPSGRANLTIEGKGTIAVRSKAQHDVEFIVKTGKAYPMLVLEISRHEVKFWKEESRYKAIPLAKTRVREGGHACVPLVAHDEGTVYWLSIDRSNWVLRYGKYYTCKAMTLYEVRLNSSEGEWLTKLTSVEVNNDGIEAPRPKVSRLPVTMDLPPIVAKNELISLKDLNLSRVTVWANLPQACQKLYHNVAGNKITLETEDFKEFSHVIHTSVTTPGYWGHRALRSKCKDPENPDPSEFRYKYLRVTIGSSQGNSPGIPYVMEVWPPGHRSVIHDHGDACAVIRVLSGSIQCTWYEALINGEDPVPLGNPVELEKDQITWLGDNHYQVHALQNNKKGTCVTLQCYEFPRHNNLHEEKFRYINATTREKEVFTPNSDCSFEVFYEIMLWEAKNHRPYPIAQASSY